LLPTEVHSYIAIERLRALCVRERLAGVAEYSWCVALREACLGLSHGRGRRVQRGGQLYERGVTTQEGSLPVSIHQLTYFGLQSTLRERQRGDPLAKLGVSGTLTIACRVERACHNLPLDPDYVRRLLASASATLWHSAG